MMLILVEKGDYKMRDIPICSLCNKYIDPNRIQLSIIMNGINRFDEYIICRDCFGEMDEKITDYEINKKFKRIRKYND